MNYFKSTILIVSILTIISCNQTTTKTQEKKPSFMIKGFLNNISAKEVYLYHRQKQLKTAKVANDTFSFSGSVIKPVLYTIKSDSITVLAHLIVDNTTSHLFIKPNEYNVYGGSKEQQQITAYKNDLKKFDLQKKVLIDSFLSYHKSYKIASLLDSIKSIENKKFAFSANTISSSLPKEMKELILTNLIENKDISLSKLDILKENVKENYEWTRLVDQKISILKEEEKRRKEEIEKKKRLIRRKAPIFTGESLNGDLTSTDVIRGKKLILIDFWASWCGPCRQVTPQIKYFYQKYKDKGFDIITISEDKNKNDWKTGIEQDGIKMWHHIFDDDMRIAYMFNVLSIPHMVLLDEQGRIIKDKISMNQLEQELSNLN
ncbi:MAG: AhpC/TSA family protein [Flavobacteriaceae bacterium]|nr:AhpC/TSA family protein [Flavobacteriaceae bacterium]